MHFLVLQLYLSDWFLALCVCLRLCTDVSSSWCNHSGKFRHNSRVESWLGCMWRQRYVIKRQRHVCRHQWYISELWSPLQTVMTQTRLLLMAQYGMGQNWWPRPCMTLAVDRTLNTSKKKTACMKKKINKKHTSCFSQKMQHSISSEYRFSCVFAIQKVFNHSSLMVLTYMKLIQCPKHLCLSRR